MPEHRGSAFGTDLHSVAALMLPPAVAETHPGQLYVPARIAGHVSVVL